MLFIRPSPAHPHLKRSVSFLRPLPPYRVRVHPSSRANPAATAMAASPPQLQQLTITRPDDWHLHLREGDVLAAMLPYSARHFGRAIVMPNLKPPVMLLRLFGVVVGALQDWLIREIFLYLNDQNQRFQMKSRNGSGV